MTTATTTMKNMFGRTPAKTAELPALTSEPLKPYSKPEVEIVIPVYNEAVVIEKSITTLLEFMKAHFPYDYRITIVDNGSDDATWSIAQQLSKDHNKVFGLHLNRKGRGQALKQAWSKSHADILVYMDVDLSTDLMALEPLVRPLINGNAAVATGSRLQKRSSVKRSLKREIISRSYNYILRAALHLKTSDAQCGFKAIRADVAKRLLPSVADDAWFFDTELLVKAERLGMPVHEVAVHWREDPDSRVNIMKTSIDDLKGVKRLRKELPGRPRWEKRTIAIILVLATALYIYGMTKNGYGNSFYAAAVQAGTKSWKAFFFGSLDASNFITVDKPPFALWVMELFTRIFGFHSWSMLLPNALAGTGTIYVVYASVRRWFNAQSALIAAGVMALTPIAVVMFGFDNPDAILTLLLTVSMYAFIRALENHHPLRWLSIAGIMTGCAFNTKMLQGLFVLPIFAVVYFFFAKPKFVIRLKHLLLAAIPTALASLWWPIIISLIPKADRPYIGSSTNDSIWNLIFGYNGINRLLGKSSGQSSHKGLSAAHLGTGSTSALPAGFSKSMAHLTAGGFGGRAGGPGGAGFGGSTGIFRMFNTSFGPNIAWFIGLALLGGLLVLWLTRRAPRSDRTRLAILAWGGWLIIHIVLFSIVGGTIHPYYPVVMAPAIAALVGITVPIMLREYKLGQLTALVLPIGVALTGIVACILLGYDATWLPWLRWVVLSLSLVSSAGLILHILSPVKKLVVPLLIAAAVACAAAPAAYSLSSVMQAHTGSIPTAGPTATAMAGSNNVSAEAESALVRYLVAHKGTATWIVAVSSANSSAPIQISSGQPVMAVGGFSGSDNAITLSQFKTLIQEGKIRYYAVSASGAGFGGGMAKGFGAGGATFGGGGGFGGGGTDASSILTYVEAHGVKVSYGGSDYTLYDLKG